MNRPFLWLHIRKAGGISVREALGDKYPMYNHHKVPCPFVALPRELWNDNLNNYRMPLGGYDFRRMQFAKRFLYTESEFDRLFKFAIVRNPYSRVVSAWRYLTRQWKISWPRQVLSHYSFGHFLDRLPEFWENIQMDRHVATHTAPIWPDITDSDGTVLLDYIGRLENINNDFYEICKYIGLPAVELPHRNVSGPAGYRKYYGKKHVMRVEKYYWNDINELGYEF